MLAVLPMFHGFGLGVCIHTAILKGCTIILVPQFNADSFAKLLRKKKPSFIAGVPTLYEALLRNDRLKGVDFSKAVVITDESYIDSSIEPHLRQNEFDALRGKDFKIKTKMEKYIADYKKAKNALDKPINQTLVKYSTLQYFEQEIGL